MQVVFEQLRAHVQGLTHRYPACLVGIVAAAHRRQLAGRKLEVETVGDGAATLAAVRVVEHLLALQRPLQHRQRNLQAGFLAQFAQAAVEQALFLADEAAGQCPQPLPGSERRRTSSTWPECTTTASVVTKVGA